MELSCNIIPPRGPVKFFYNSFVAEGNECLGSKFEYSKLKGKLGNNVAETLCFLSMFPLSAHLGKHCCGNKICFSGSKNVSQQIQKHLCSANNVSKFVYMFLNVFSTRNIVSPIRHVKTFKNCIAQT